MKTYVKRYLLPITVLGGGLLTLLLRLWFLCLGRDSRGLLAVGSFPDIFSWVITCLTLVWLTIGTWHLREASKYTFNFPASLTATVGIGVAALGFFITSLTELISGTDVLGTISAILGFFAVGAMGFLAYCRYFQLRVSVLFHGFVCVYLMFHLVSHYRLWSAAPQIQTYGFELLAIVCTMLACYQRAAFDANQGQRRTHTFCSLSALFFSVAALPGCDNAIFFLGCGAWMLTTLCNLTPLPGLSSKHDG